MTVTEQEVTQYDRQIRLWGLEAQNRLRSSKILLFGLKPLGAEICKNLVLAGIGEISVCDSEPINDKTLLMTNGTEFKTVAEASKARIEELNPRVKVNLVPGSSKDKDESFFADFTLVIITDIVDKSELVRITDIARKKNSKIIVGAQFGLHGVGFNDFQAHDYTFTPDATSDKEEPKTQKASKQFRAFSDVIVAEDPKWTKREKKNQWHIPLNVFKAALESSAALKDDEVNKRFGLESEVIAESTMDVPPVGAILGGVLGQEAIKAIGFKEAPLDNFFLFNGQQMCGNKDEWLNMRNNLYSAEPQILDDSDEDFDPKTEDIHQYCKIIGLDPDKEPDLLWIAKEGILAKLEPPWKAINQEDVGLYYFNFETGDSMWEHPNDQHYRQKVARERDRIKNKHKSPKDVQSPRLAPLRTPRSQTDQSISNSLEFLKSSNDSSKMNLGKKPVLGSKSEGGDSDEDISTDTSSSDNSNIQMDIGALQPVIRSGSDPKIDESLSLSETKDSETKDSDSSFKVAGNKFLKNNSVPSKDPESYSMSNASKSSSKHSKSVTSSHSRPKSGKMVPKINPTTASKIVNQSSTPQNASNMGIPNTISVQIEQKKKQAGIEIEEEMKKVQLELLEKRQERYEEIMEAHESEMYRMEREAQKINNEQEQLKQDKLNELRNKFESDINEAIQREQEQHEMTKSSAINGLRATLEREKKDVLVAEEEKIKSEIETYKLGIIRKNNLKLKEIKDEIEREEKQKMDKLNEELLSKKHENERLANQDKEMFEKLRAERSILEERNKNELLKLQEEHNIKKQNLQNRNNQEFREVENAHLTKMKDLHLKFEAELNEKKKFLESKRKEFDTKIEKWERGHSQRKIAWAENSMRRNTELETEAATEAKRSQKNTPNQSFEEPPMTREDLETSPKSKLHIPINQTSRQPASERLREYLKGLEKKLESVSTMVDGPNSGGKRWEPSHRSTSHMTSSSQPDYVSERWKAYFGQDFKYIPAKQELEQRTINDYRYKQNAPTDKLREIIRTSSY